MPKRAESERCPACEFFVLKGTVAGRCYRFPPLAGSSGSGYPTVMQENWCGEFKAAPIEDRPVDKKEERR